MTEVQPGGQPGSVRRLAARAAAVFTSALAVLAPMLSAPANANPVIAYGNFSLAIPDRFDFHTWTFNVGACENGCQPCPGECRRISAIAQPIARAYQWVAPGRFVDGNWVVTVDDPFGLRCGNVYYGATFPTRDVYTWNDVTLAGNMVSTFDVGCDGRPGTLNYPIWLTRL